jgi:Flp pilus assembly protein TadD
MGLLVIDNLPYNAAQTIDELAEYLPKWRLLVTTRNHLSTRRFNQHQLKSTDRNAVKIFNFYYRKQKQQNTNWFQKILLYFFKPKSPVSTEELQEFCEEIDNHTLTLELIGTAMAQFPISLSDIRKKIKEKKISDDVINQLIKTEYLSDNEQDGKKIRIYKCLLVTFENVLNLSKKQRHLLEIFILLPPFIWKKNDWIVQLGLSKTDYFDAENYLIEKGWLESYNKSQSKWESFWNTVNESKNYRVHPLVRTVLLHHLRPSWENNNDLISHFEKSKSETVDILRISFIEIIHNLFQFAPDIPKPQIAFNIGDIFLEKFLQYQLCIRLFTVAVNGYKIEGSKKGLANSYQKIGEIHHTLGELIKSLEMFEVTNSLFEQLHKAHPNNIDFKHRFIISFQWLGNVNADLGKLDNALKLYEIENNLAKELYESYPNNVSFKNNLAIAYEKLGETHSALGNLKLALDFFEKDIQLTKELYESYPNNVSFKNGLAIAYSKLGDTHSALGNLKLALDFFEKFTKLMKELYESYPNNVSFKNNLAIAYSKLGSTHSALGNLKLALDFFEKRSALGKELYESYPNNVSFKNGLAIAYEKLGSTHSALGNLKLALDFFEKRSALGKELYESYPNNVSFKNGLAIAYAKLGETHSDLGNLKLALDFFEKRSALGKELYESYPNNVSFKNGLAIAYEKLGETHSDLGNLKLALDFFEIETRLFEELYESYPNNVSFKNGLAISYAKLGQQYQAANNRLKAFDYFKNAEKLWEELVIQSPQYVQFQQFLGIVRNILKDLG